MSARPASECRTFEPLLLPEVGEAGPSMPVSSPDHAQAMADHLAKCPACRAKQDAWRVAGRELKQLPRLRAPGEGMSSFRVARQRFEARQQDALAQQERRWRPPLRRLTRLSAPDSMKDQVWSRMGWSNRRRWKLLRGSVFAAAAAGIVLFVMLGSLPSRSSAVRPPVALGPAIADRIVVEFRSVDSLDSIPAESRRALARVMGTSVPRLLEGESR